MEQNSLEEKFKLFSPRYRWQFISTLMVHIMTFTHGVSVGWLSPTLRLLSSENSPLGYEITFVEASWIGSLMGLGSLVGNIGFGLLLDRIGRKTCMYGLAIPNMCYWILIYTAESVDYLYAGRFLAGVAGGGAYVALPIFISEIVDDRIRGALSSMAMMNVCFGTLIGFIMASYLSYYLMPCIVIALPIIYLLAIFNLPETPIYLIRRGRDEKAEKSYRFYKNLKNSPSDQNESEKHDDVKNEFKLYREMVLQGGVREKVTWQDFINKPTLKVFVLIFVLIVTNQMSGSFANLNYTSNIFAELENRLNVNTCTVVVGVAQVVGILCAVMLVDRFGRRVLLLTSMAGMGLGELAIGLLKDLSTSELLAELYWLPLTLMCWVAFIAAVGMVSLVFTIIMELLPAKIRSIGTSLSMATFSFFIFVSLKIYPIMIANSGLGPTMYMAASFCTFGFIVLGLFLPETKGKLMTH
ncbi:facilitated trehalose transporter Tret1-like [Scaptodrosophila lebanonensis]|uniref:Facilitated trehalose transporter Tret1-like n=1 Tax=Drosophila lebanonensis TaxID=7225 RepID=A0A6J2TG23_DROLE|nr:facilitated trehalose transporter Tret1-like [Scaptodrosophila lebanonensis]